MTRCLTPLYWPRRLNRLNCGLAAVNCDVVVVASEVPTPRFDCVVSITPSF